MLDLLETRCPIWFATCCIAHICITDMTSLISFLLILFYHWAAFVVYQQNWVNNTTWNSLTSVFSVNHIQVGCFRGCSRIGMQRCPLPKIYHTYPTMMKLSTVILYLTKIQNIYKSRDTPIRFRSVFFHQKSATSFILRNTDIDCILIHTC